MNKMCYNHHMFWTIMWVSGWVREIETHVMADMSRGLNKSSSSRVKNGGRDAFTDGDLVEPTTIWKKTLQANEWISTLLVSKYSKVTSDYLWKQMLCTHYTSKIHWMWTLGHFFHELVISEDGSQVFWWPTNFSNTTISSEYSFDQLFIVWYVLWSTVKLVQQCLLHDLFFIIHCVVTMVPLHLECTDDLDNPCQGDYVLIACCFVCLSICQ